MNLSKHARPLKRECECVVGEKNVAAIDNMENQREDFSWFLTEIVVFSPFCANDRILSPFTSEL